MNSAINRPAIRIGLVVAALFTTPYGRLLLVKLTLFAMLIAIGARNRFLIKAKPLKAPTGRNVLSQLRRNVICEAWLGLQ